VSSLSYDLTPLKAAIYTENYASGILIQYHILLTAVKKKSNLYYYLREKANGSAGGL
jgi:hypothetical protein